MIRYSLLLLCVVALCAQARADYIITPLSASDHWLEVWPGESFDLDVVLESDGADANVSAIFRVEFSRPGLVYESCTWRAPYSIGSIDERSVPGGGGPALPQVLDEGVLAGLGYPDGVVDIELSNVTDSGAFQAALLVTLGLSIPADMPPGAIAITVLPDTLDDGMRVVTTLPGESFTLVVVPEPTSAALLVGGLALLRRRRRTAGRRGSAPGARAARPTT